MGFLDGSGISWTMCKQSAPCSRHITTSTPHHSIFTGRMLFLTPNQQCQSTEGTNNLGYNFCEMVKKWGLTSFRPRRKTVLVGKRRPAVSNSFCRSSPNLSMTRKRFVVLPSLCWPVAMKRGMPSDFSLWDVIHSRTDNNRTTDLHRTHTTV